MKKLRILYFLLIFTSLNSFSQNYKPMLVDGNEWYLNEIGHYGGSYGVIKIVSDTSINSNIYKKLISYYNLKDSVTPLSEEIMVREDTSERKIYQLINDSTEALLYDFSLNVGELITFNNTAYKVDSITTFINDSICYDLDTTEFSKIHHLSPNGVNSQNENIIWIEGIGSLTNTFHCNLLNLICFTDSTNYRFFHGTCNDPYHNDSCFVGIKRLGNIIETITSNITLKPNPVQNEITISSENKILITNVSIMSIQGNIIFEQNKINQTQIKADLSSYESGIYFVKTKMKDNSISVQKIIKN